MMERFWANCSGLQFRVYCLSIRSFIMTSILDLSIHRNATIWRSRTLPTSGFTEALVGSATPKWADGGGFMNVTLGTHCKQNVRGKYTHGYACSAFVPFHKAAHYGVADPTKATVPNDSLTRMSVEIFRELLLKLLPRFNYHKRGYSPLYISYR